MAAAAETVVDPGDLCQRASTAVAAAAAAVGRADGPVGLGGTGGGGGSRPVGHGRAVQLIQSAEAGYRTRRWRSVELLACSSSIRLPTYSQMADWRLPALPSLFLLFLLLQLLLLSGPAPNLRVDG